MEKLKCEKCKKHLRESMELQYSKEICVPFCSKKCANEYYCKEFRNVTLDIKNTRAASMLYMIRDGKLYHSNLEDDWCCKCRKEQLIFSRYATIESKEYEIFKCNGCGHEELVEIV
ncbi:hypothetical protein KPL40_03870 [Clostridium gasigenes]|uniref:hypothetical protein n=1 Tax=Clostridium gasigenes TaxID=94869 RepID=UPI001C0CA3F2|nr:hypothetical protein [Clostridium gasigenes]MBU3131579.1 hypothetical protein [Clostridium gasigenes]